MIMIVGGSANDNGVQSKGRAEDSACAGWGEFSKLLKKLSSMEVMRGSQGHFKYITREVGSMAGKASALRRLVRGVGVRLTSTTCCRCGTLTQLSGEGSRLSVEGLTPHFPCEEWRGVVR